MKSKKNKDAQSYEQFLKELDEIGVVGCNHRVMIVPPASSEPKEGKAWTLVIYSKARHSTHTVVVAWYRTRAAARIHAKRLRKSLKQLIIR
jgi:hypothetical protein